MPGPRGETAAADALAYAALGAGWYGVLRTGSPAAAFAFFLASRTAYVVFAGFSLRAQDESGWWTRRWGPEEGFRRFKRAVSLFMNNDGASIALVCWMSRGTLGTDLPDGALAALGAVLILLGSCMKAWAVATLGKGSYHWESFFIPRGEARYVVAGPYRWFANPMYTVGYAHAYGIALCLRSVPGLIAALVAQSLMLLFNHWAERPHTERMRAPSAGPEAAE